jgi:hypothetical protein
MVRSHRSNSVLKPNLTINKDNIFEPLFDSCRLVSVGSELGESKDYFPKPT